MTGEEISVLRNMPSSYISSQPSSHSDDSSSSRSHTSPGQHQRSPPTSPRYHELMTVPNAYERSVPSSFNYQQTVPVGSWATCASAPDLRRPMDKLDMGPSGTDLSMYGSSEGFSNFLNLSSDSLGSLKIGSSGELLLDRDSLRGSSGIGSQGTLDSGFGSTFLSSLINDQHQLGSLKELSHSEVADTLLSLKHSRMKINPYGPSAASAPANPCVEQPYQTAELASSTGSLPASRGTSESYGSLRNHRYLISDYDTEHEDDGPLSRPFSSTSSLDPTSYSYWIREPHGRGTISSSRHLLSSSGNLIAKALSTSSIGLVDGYETSRLPETAYWAVNQSTPGVFESTKDHYIGAANNADYHANSPGSSAQLYTTPARVATIKSTEQLDAYSSASHSSLSSSRSSVTSAFSSQDDARLGIATKETSSSLTKIQSNDSLIHRCHFCEKKFSRPGALKTHTKIHFGEKQYMCHVCSKAFFQAANLKAHLRVHSGEKPFSCNICGKGFSQSSSVKTHARTHSGERPYTCRQCNRSFSDNSTLTKHQRIHSGQKPYTCTYCRQSFSQSGNLSRHMKIHDKAKN
ncbi:zinc finger protein 354A-like [Lytechinus pictus]|uniref:zinc finger protein 354A-like n=1 Tax=Lytechinus pictus TaxID=7653 RepID=UPI0030B9C817